MSATGIRTREATWLVLGDTDARAWTLTVTGKDSKTRMLPLHDTVLAGFARYLSTRPHPLVGALSERDAEHGALP